MLQPVSVALKFGFLAVLFLFLLWVSRSALKDLSRIPGGGHQPLPGDAAPPGDATGMYSAAAGVGPGTAIDPRLVVERAPGHAPGMEYEIGAGAVMGRGDQADIRLDDPYASATHTRLTTQGGVVVIEDLGSTNGTYLNEELLTGPQPLHDGDRIRIGDSEFTYASR